MSARVRRVERGEEGEEGEKARRGTYSREWSVVGLTGLKYLAYDRLVFLDRAGARRSRHQVPSTTEQNRSP